MAAQELEAAARAEKWDGSIHQWARLGGAQGRDWWEPRLAEIAKTYPATAAYIRYLIAQRYGRG